MDVKNNFATHRLALYKTAYDLTENGLSVKVDYSVSEHGHLIVKEGSNEFRVLVKALSDLSPIPISRNEYDNIGKFTHIWLTTGVYSKDFGLFSIPISETKNLIKINYSPNGEENRWIDTDKYLKFKVNKFTLP